jgi:hypothetical protein
MFSGSVAKQLPGNHAVLMDGQATSFALSICDDARQLEDRPVSWSWSSDVNHALVVDTQRSEFFVRRWDYPLVRRFRLPSQIGQAREIALVLKKSGALRAPDVVSHVLRAFRQVRSALRERPPIESVKVFLALLVAAEKAKFNLLKESDISGARTVSDVVQILKQSGVQGEEFAEVGTETKSVQLGTLASSFIEPEPLTGCILDPSLLLRHAAGRLFQEANLIVERDEIEQLHFAGLAPEKALKGVLGRDVRFTPPTLARTLVERSLDTLQNIPKKFTAFDPACGSGVFLIEILRELQTRGFEGEATVCGFDTSEVSCLLARFCLARAAAEIGVAKFRTSVQIEKREALGAKWPEFEVAMMNPPFVPWERMDKQEREQIGKILGGLSQGRSDKAMAFVWKAVQQLKQGRALGAVLPAPLLESRSGEGWREAISRTTQMRLLGKFHGFGYFTASLVEPAFIVLSPGSDRTKPDVKIVLSQSGFEDDCLRALRLGVETMPGATEGWEIYSAAAGNVTAANWMPRSQADLEMIRGLVGGALTTIGDLFHVRQGIRMGHACFLISEAEFQALRQKEKRYFRPAATNATIREGRVFSGEWVFYPYGEKGPLVGSEAELRAELPTYFETCLKPVKAELQRRAKVDPKTWWLLTRERGWQHEKQPKLVSTYFGGRGRFACDKTGEFAVVQGHGWLWRKPPAENALPGQESNRWFFQTDLPFAYLAVFNSATFERLLALYCPRVQGGQFDLSNRFVDKIPVPDLSDFTRFDADTSASLAETGRKIHSGRLVDMDHLEELVAHTYCVTPAAPR